jgi:hypothetical protein
MSENVLVAVRCRPFSEKEKFGNYEQVVQMNNNQSVTVTSKDKKSFTFDVVFGPNTSQVTIIIDG